MLLLIASTFYFCYAYSNWFLFSPIDNLDCPFFVVSPKARSLFCIWLTRRDASKKYNSLKMEQNLQYAAWSKCFYQCSSSPFRLFQEIKVYSLLWSEMQCTKMQFTSKWIEEFYTRFHAYVLRTLQHLIKHSFVWEKLSSVLDICPKYDQPWKIYVFVGKKLIHLSIDAASGTQWFSILAKFWSELSAYDHSNAVCSRIVVWNICSDEIRRRLNSEIS